MHIRHWFCRCLSRVDLHSHRWRLSLRCQRLHRDVEQWLGHLQEHNLHRKWISTKLHRDFNRGPWWRKGSWTHGKNLKLFLQILWTQVDLWSILSSTNCLCHYMEIRHRILLAIWRHACSRPWYTRLALSIWKSICHQIRCSYSRSSYPFIQSFSRLAYTENRLQIAPEYRQFDNVSPFHQCCQATFELFETERLSPYLPNLEGQNQILLVGYNDQTKYV